MRCRWAALGEHTFSTPGTYAIEPTLRDEVRAETVETAAVTAKQPNQAWIASGSTRHRSTPAETAIDGVTLSLGKDPWGLTSSDILETLDVSSVDVAAAEDQATAATLGYRSGKRPCAARIAIRIASGRPSASP